ncbi:MAG: hypothetical protein J6X66_14750 [Lachnospiraceae bacterium]|nr:hypothetical protein [Lachnospiraceae bacterium]
MRPIEIDEDNAEDFSDYIDEDMIDNMDRTFFRGIGVADDDDMPLGALVFELINSESEEDTLSRIHSFKVENDEAKELILSEYEKLISEEDVAESFYELADEETAMLLKDSGFSFDTSESVDIVVNMLDIRRVAESVKSSRLPSFIGSLSAISIFQYRSCIKNCLFKGRYGLLEDLAYLPKNWFEQNVSACSLSDEAVDGVLLLKKAPSGMLSVLLYTAFGPDFQKSLALMMIYTARKILELYTDDTKLLICRHNDMVKKLTDKVFANSRGETVYKGKRKEG